MTVLQPESGRPERPDPGSPIGLEPAATRVQAPAREGVGVKVPARRDPCCVQWFAIQRDACDIDAPDPPDLTERQLRVPDAP